MAAIARRRLEMLSAELAGIRGSLAAERETDEAADPAEQAAAPDTASARPEDTGGGPGLPIDLSTRWDGAAPRGRHALRPIGRSDRVGAWVHERLPPTLQGRVRLESGHLSVVAVLVAAAFAVTAWWVVRADGGAMVAPAATWSQTAERADASEPAALVTPASDPSAPGVSPTEGAVLVVDVTGKVRHPGIATLPVGSRVVDALEAAGGARQGVDLSMLNLARLLVDGEQIVVGVPPPTGVAAPAASAPGGQPAGAGPMVNINSASETELEELPGVGPVTAAAIVQWRTDNGPFTSVDELLEVSGIGDATLAEMAPFVTL